MNDNKYSLSLENIFTNLSANIDEIKNKYNNAITNFDKNMMVISLKLNDAFNNPNVQSVFKNLTELQENYPDLCRDNIIKLANYGWFLDFKRTSVTKLISIVNQFNKGHLAEMDEYLCQEFKKNLDGIKNDLIWHFPARKVIFEKAFIAHDNKDYELAIPVLLTQVDGICYDSFKKEFFLSEKKAPKTNEYFLEYFNGHISDIIFKKSMDIISIPLRMKTTIGLDETARKKEVNFTGLNRHQILHGEVTDYANEINSFKVISLLGYVQSIIKLLNDKGLMDKTEGKQHN